MGSEIGGQDAYVERAGGGWLFFAGTLLGLAGISRIFDAIWVFRADDALELEGAILGTSLSTYGWVWLIVGFALLAASFSILNGSELARWIGIIAGSLLAISAFWWMPFYPVWSLAYVAIGLLVIYALSTYGGRRPA